MTKVSKVYSPYQIKRALADKVVQIASKTFKVNDKNTVCYNGRYYRCSCKWADDNKLHLKYCHCVLATLRFIDPDLFWTEVSEK